MTADVKHYRKKREYDKPLLNNLVMNKNHKGHSMDKENHYCFETKQDGIRMILEFPKKKRTEEDIKSDIKHILTGVLKQDITNVS